MLKTLPDTPERAQQELGLQIALGPALMAIKGSAAPEVEHAYARARELCQQVGETPQLFPVLWGLWRFYIRRAEYQTARELGEQLLTPGRAASTTRRSSWRPTMRWGLPCAGWESWPLARAHLEQGIALYDPQQHHALAFLYGGMTPECVCLAYAALALWMLGYPDQALRGATRRSPWPRSWRTPLAWRLPWTLRPCSISSAGRSKPPTSGQRQLIALSTEQGFAHYLAQGTILRGWALAAQGQGEEGMAQMRQGLAAYQATGAE